MDHTLRRYGLWDKLITDRGPQFASQVMQGIHKKLGITSALSTAYHPQTDGQTERYNQELEQYLRIFCNYRQDDWVDHLPFAEICHNIRIHSATGTSPFGLLHGYEARFYPSINPTSNIPAVEDRLKLLKELREEVKSSLERAAQIMREQHGNHLMQMPAFKVGDKVLLDGKNIKTTRPKAKLTDKRHGPFEIAEVIGPVNYKLKLPQDWRIHPVFHANLLLPYTETEEHGPNFPHEPDELDEEEVDGKQYDLEEILDSKKVGNTAKYFAKWLDYPPSENSWVYRSWLSPDSLHLIDEFHAKNPDAYNPAQPSLAPARPPQRRQGRKRAPRKRTVRGVNFNDILGQMHTHAGNVLQAQAHLKEGVMSRTVSFWY
jgi:chromodomain-containing protein